MSPINVMLNGLPGNVSSVIATGIAQNSDFQLLPWSFTGPEITAKTCQLANVTVNLVLPQYKDAVLNKIKVEYGSFLTVDYTHPSAVNANAEYYCQNGLPFIMGTTGGDRAKLTATVENSDICAVIAPNMAKQIVALQSIFDYAAQNFPGVFSEYNLTVRESHQKGKADTSGTARAIVRLLNKLGLEYDVEQIEKERDPEKQKSEWGVPEEFLGGHAWHTYTIAAKDGNSLFEFKHNINGRSIYIEGTMDALRFLNKKAAGGAKGQVYSMIDVMRG